MLDTGRKLLVCYVPGLDRRRVTEEATPAIAALLDRFSAVEIQTLPDTELVPTLLSGVNPHQNQVWQVSLKEPRALTRVQRITDMLPDLITTTLQCVRQKFDADFDLAAIPPQRRRQFKQHRLKYTRRVGSPEVMQNFNGYSTLFGILGAESRYRFTHDFAALDVMSQELLDSPLRFEFVEMYALDLFQHWHLDDSTAMNNALAKTDDFVADLADGCRKNGKTLVLLSDHGQELVTNTLPLLRELAKWGVPRSEFNFFCELACTRFWFHTDSARAEIVPRLRQLQHCQLFHFSEMNAFDVCFEDSAFGEYYLIAEAGSIFFPHDFYQPVANIYLGLSGGGQRSRVFDPVHKGNHGYLPHYPSEKGFLLLTEDAIKPHRPRMSLIDFAPTMLACLGEAVPAHMSGQSVV